MLYQVKVLQDLKDEDIAKELGTVGYLEKLVRTKVGFLELKDAIKLSEVSIDSPLIPISKILTHYKKVAVDDITVKKVKDGMTLPFDASEEYILLVDKEDTALAIYKKVGKNNMYRCFRGLW